VDSNIKKMKESKEEVNEKAQEDQKLYKQR
jgi:hypothetical protein